MIKIKQLLGMIFFICIYEIMTLHPQDAEIFGIFEIYSFNPIKYIQFYNPKNVFFYLAPTILVVYVFSLIRYFKENSSSFTKIFAYLIISIYLVIEMLDFLFKYNASFLLNLNIDWKSLFENLGGIILTSPNMDPTVNNYSWLVVSITSLLSNWWSIILLFLFLIMVIFVLIISYITFRNQIKSTSKIRDEIQEQTNISKKFYFIKPMNLIFIKRRLKFFKDFDKNEIYRKDPSYFRGKKKSIIICFSCGLFLLLVWILLNLFLDPVGTISMLTFRGVNIHFGYYSLWIILPFRIMQSLAFGYGISLLIKIWKKISTFINIEFEQSLIRNQNPNGLGISDDYDKFDTEDIKKKRML